MERLVIYFKKQSGDFVGETEKNRENRHVLCLISKSVEVRGLTADAPHFSLRNKYLCSVSAAVSYSIDFVRLSTRISEADKV
jgi:hypothetical protein